jgi:hypothetical protein
VLYMSGFLRIWKTIFRGSSMETFGRTTALEDLKTGCCERKNKHLGGGGGTKISVFLD